MKKEKENEKENEKEKKGEKKKREKKKRKKENREEEKVEKEKEGGINLGDVENTCSCNHHTNHWEAHPQKFCFHAKKLFLQTRKRKGLLFHHHLWES